MWIITSICSLLLGSHIYAVFVGFRALGAASSAVFEILMPVLLADMFADRALGVAMMFASGCELVSGLAIGVANSWILTAKLPWQSGLIFGPLISIAPLIVLACTGRSFGSSDRQGGGLNKGLSTAFGLFRNKSYVIVVVATSFVAFAMGAYTFWLPSMFLNAWNSTPDAFPGLSYTAITILNSIFIMSGFLVGLPPILWFAQSWRHGTGPFTGRQGFVRAYPVVASGGAVVWTAAYALYIILVVESYVATLACIFFVGMGQAVQACISQLMLLLVMPSSSRSSGVALHRLIIVIVSTPSAQIMGMISDAIRGDSTLPLDSFHAYQKALLFASVFMIAATIFFIILIVFFPGDCEKAEELHGIWPNQDEEEDAVTETTSLLHKSRTNSIMEHVVRSRATSGDTANTL
ncbi:hypothetical protein PRIPAC_86110 [Pristionchus pacificus]|nr:hypothetical protein PRIPAC_86110 [Pristionchus pacificus]